MIGLTLSSTKKLENALVGQVKKLENMKDLAIYGAGGFGREIACLINLINQSDPQWNIVGFFDDGKEIGTKNEYGEVLGGIDELNNWDKSIAVVLAIGNPKVLSKIASSIKNTLVDFPNIISPDVTFLDANNLTLGKGNVICTGCLISCNVHIGDFNIFNGLITVGHDTLIGNFNAIMPAVRISGEVKIGNENFFGVASTVLQQIRIGNNTTVGANSLILRKTKDGMTYVGNPATIVHY